MLIPYKYCYIKSISNALYKSKLNLDIIISDNNIQVKLPEMNNQRKLLIIANLSQIYDQFKANVTTAKQEILKKIKLIKICNDHKLLMINQINIATVKATNLSIELIMKFKTKLMNLKA